MTTAIFILMALCSQSTEWVQTYKTKFDCLSAEKTTVWSKTDGESCSLTCVMKKLL